MVRKLFTENGFAAKNHHIIAVRDNGLNRVSVVSFNLLFQLNRIERGRNFIYNQADLFDMQPRCDAERDGRTFEILLIGAHDDNQFVGNGNG